MSSMSHKLLGVRKQANSVCRLRLSRGSLLPRTKKNLRSTKKTISNLVLAAVIISLILCAPPLHAERKYTLGHSLDFLAGASDESGQVGPDLTTLNPGLHTFYSVYPSIDLSSEGQHSTYDLHYSFVGERFNLDPALTTTSHSFTGNFAAQMGRRTHIKLSDTFNTVPDYSLLNVLRGTVPGDQFRYIFEPQLYKRTQLSNSAGIGLDIDLTEKSYITFEGAGAFRFYEEDAENALLSDQTRSEGSFSFSHRQSPRLSWSLKYTFLQNDYEVFATSRTHSAKLILSGSLSPTWELGLEAGPSFTERRESVKEYVSYIANLDLTRQLRTNRFSVRYSHNAADSTGLGSSTESHQGIVDFEQMLGRKALLNFQALAFNQDQRESNLYDYWGAQGSIALTRQFGRYLDISIGASYMTYIGGTGLYEDYSSKRFYAGIGYRIPELWQVER